MFDRTARQYLLDGECLCRADRGLKIAPLIDATIRIE
jgi:hypothetical protein